MDDLEWIAILLGLSLIGLLLIRLLATGEGQGDDA